MNNRQRRGQPIHRSLVRTPLLLGTEFEVLAVEAAVVWLVVGAILTRIALGTSASLARQLPRSIPRTISPAARHAACATAMCGAVSIAASCRSWLTVLTIRSGACAMEVINLHGRASKWCGDLGSGNRRLRRDAWRGGSGNSRRPPPPVR
jgi:hypothetical protein